MGGCGRQVARAGIRAAFLEEGSSESQLGIGEERVWGKEWHKPRLGGDRAWPAGLREVCAPGPRTTRTLWRPCRGHLREPWKVAEQIRVSAEAGKAGGPSGSLGGSDLGCGHEGS